MASGIATNFDATNATINKINWSQSGGISSASAGVGTDGSVTI